MTNEEAIKRLKSDIYKYSDFTENPNENEFWTAFDMAIKALEQEPCEDAISRADAINAMSNAIKRVFPEHRDIAEKTMNNLPSVTPQPKTGRWIPVSEMLPEAGKQYLCCNEDGFREVGYLSKVTGEWGFTDTEAFGEVIAWMPLPEPMKAESEVQDADSN